MEMAAQPLYERFLSDISPPPDPICHSRRNFGAIFPLIFENESQNNENEHIEPFFNPNFNLLQARFATAGVIFGPKKVKYLKMKPIIGPKTSFAAAGGHLRQLAEE